MTYPNRPRLGLRMIFVLPVIHMSGIRVCLPFKNRTTTYFLKTTRPVDIPRSEQIKACKEGAPGAAFHWLESRRCRSAGKPKKGQNNLQSSIHPVHVCSDISLTLISAFLDTGCLTDRAVLGWHLSYNDQRRTKTSSLFLTGATVFLPYSAEHDGSQFKGCSDLGVHLYFSHRVGLIRQRFFPI